MVQRYGQNHPNCDFAQPGALFRKVLNDKGKKNLVENIVGHLGGARRDVNLKLLTS